jgi:hypothetical protein
VAREGYRAGLGLSVWAEKENVPLHGDGTTAHQVMGVFLDYPDKRPLRGP